MRLKEIKPGMVIHCKNISEYERLEEETIKNGYGQLPLHNRSEEFINKVVFYIHDKNCTWSGINDDYIEFSDLIMPELTAEELLNTIKEICASSNTCNDMCLLCDGNGCVIRKTEFDVKKIIEICSQWKSDNEKKEPEIETVDICRIIEIHPNGKKRCVHEEDLASGSTDAEIKIMVEAELKRYCMEHEGEFIAVHEVVSRVKK